MKILIVHSGNAVAGNSEKYTFVHEQGESLRNLGLNVQYFAIVGKGVLGYIKNYRRLQNAIASFKPDIIHAHYGLCGLLANFQRRVPVVTTYHGSDINLFRNLYLSKIAMYLSVHNIFVSPRSVNIAQLKNNYTILPCGVDLTKDQLQSRSEARQVLGLNNYDTIILFAGAFDNTVKDYPLAQETIKQLQSKQSNDQEYDTGITLKELKGFTRTEVNIWICAANCLLMTSKTEGSPQVVKEAMACGCPIVSVDVGDVAERTKGIKGCYVVPSREPEEIAKALQKAIAFEGKTNGRKRIIEMRISNEQVARQLINIYTSILS